MGIIDRIKDRFYQKSLPAKPARNKGQTPRNIEEAKTIGILFDATDIDYRKKILAYADSLRKQGKKVSTLAFISTADKEATFSFDFFTLRQIDWAQRPKGEAISHWLQHDFEVLICLFPQSSRFTEYIALHTHAGLKIGPLASNPTCYDLMLDMPATSTPQQIIKQYEQVLARTVPQKVA
ncbi:hypothetical protein [Lewinella sp. LCG006]|uniref:DUF6913 domain-containing protein n=1 Tax=Lewinella sp. LCG006 TaxID=3231911 RepID=UPI0034600270